MICPHCAKPIDPQAVRKAANSIAGKAKRPRAQGLVRNPAGRPKALCSLCGIRPRSVKFPAIIDDEPENICGYCYTEAVYLHKQTAPQPKS